MVSFTEEFLTSEKIDKKLFIIVEKYIKKRNMFLRFRKIALYVSYGFGQYRSMFLIVVSYKKAGIRGSLGSLYRHISSNSCLIPPYSLSDTAIAVFLSFCHITCLHAFLFIRNSRGPLVQEVS